MNGIVNTCVVCTFTNNIVIIIFINISNSNVVSAWRVKKTKAQGLHYLFVIIICPYTLCVLGSY